MRLDRVASLPMYDFPEMREAHDVFWGALAVRLTAAGLDHVPRTLTRGVSPAEVWGSPSLLFAQGCEFPLAKAFADRVRVVAHPIYSAPGCEGSRYRSAIVVRRRAGLTGAADAGAMAYAHDAGCAAAAATAAADTTTAAANTTGPGDHYAAPDSGAPVDALADLRGRRCVVNELDSNSGMNILRATIAPLANGDRFFDSVAVSGAHLRSVQMVASGEADVASIDCVSFAHFQRLYPSVVSGLRVLAWTPSSPSLPFITAGSASDATIRLLRSALADVFDDVALAPARKRLMLRGIDLQPEEGFREVLALERAAVDSGYPILR